MDAPWYLFISSDGTSHHLFVVPLARAVLCVGGTLQQICKVPNWISFGWFLSSFILKPAETTIYLFLCLFNMILWLIVSNFYKYYSITYSSKAF